MTLRKPFILFAIFVFALTIQTSNGRAQASQPSVVEAARKAKEQQKNQPKTAKVYTDDDLSGLKGGISVVGTEPAPAPTEAAATTPAKQAAASKEPVKNEAYWRSRFAEARRTMADDSKELDVLQREYGLKEVQFYSNPNVALREQYSRKDLDDTQAAITAKKQDVEKDNQALDNLQDELRTSGGEPGWANEPTTQADSDAAQASQPQADQQASPTADQPAAPLHDAPQIEEQPEQSQTPSPSEQH